MRIGEVARLAGVSAKAVRRFESLGLIVADRLRNGYRDFSDHHVRLVREIRELAQLGIPAQETRPFLACLADGSAHGDECPASLAVYRDAITDVTARIEALDARRAALHRRLYSAASRHAPTAVPVTDFAHVPLYLPPPSPDDAADHLVGQSIPHIVLPSTAGADVALDALGEGRSVIYLYPLTGRPETDLPDGWDSIPGARGCTPQACDFRDHYSELVQAGATKVFGLSSQDTSYQHELAMRLGLPFAILADPGFRLASDLRLPTFAAGGMRLYRRMTLIIRDGVIEHVFYPVFPPDQHAGQVLQWLTNKTARPPHNS